MNSVTKSNIVLVLLRFLENDYGENKEKSLEYVDMTITGACYILQLISHEQATELREPVVRELEKLNRN